MGKLKHYVVWRGRQTGIFDNWEICKAQVDKFPRASYKGFPTQQQAQIAWESGQVNLASPLDSNEAILSPCICVDAACNSFTGQVEFRGVFYPECREIFSSGPFKKGSINLGEFMAIFTALQYCKNHSLELPIYSDSRIALLWVAQKNLRTGVARQMDNQPLYALIDDALQWLRNNTFSNELLKWQTEIWGENPADYGRK